MPDIYHTLPIKAPANRVFEAISTPDGLNQWWTESSSGSPNLNSEYQLGFGPAYNWKAVVSVVVPDRAFVLSITDAQEDWEGSVVGFSLLHEEENTILNFYHKGWKQQNEHYTISCYCWAMYLRILKRYLEHGETVPYQDRLEV